MIIVGVIPIYNFKDDYLSNITLLSRMVDKLFLIDDSESENEMVKKVALDNGAEYVWNGQNIGLSRSANRGLALALKEHADWIFFMDQDSAPNNNIIEIYKEYIANNNTSRVALLAPQYNYDRHPCKEKDGCRDISYANLSGSLLNLKAIRKIGKFDVRFFIDGLDIEWCLRARKKGYKLIECSKAVLDHSPASTRYVVIFGKRVFSYGYSTVERHYYQIRSCLQIANRYFDGRNICMMLYKFFKSVFWYGNPEKYMQANYWALMDYKNGYYGKRRFE